MLKRPLALLVAAVLMISSCSGSADSEELAQVRAELDALKEQAVTTTLPAATTEEPQTSTTAPTVATTTTHAFSSGVPCSLGREGRFLVDQWMKATGELDHLRRDPSVSGDQYVVASERLKPNLDQVVLDMLHMRMCLPPGELVLLNSLVPIFGEWLDSYYSLETAVRNGSLAVQADLVEAQWELMTSSSVVMCDIAAVIGDWFKGAFLCSSTP